MIPADIHADFVQRTVAHRLLCRPLPSSMEELLNKTVSDEEEPLLLESVAVIATVLDESKQRGVLTKDTSEPERDSAVAPMMLRKAGPIWMRCPRIRTEDLARLARMLPLCPSVALCCLMFVSCLCLLSFKLFLLQKVPQHFSKTFWLRSKASIANEQDTCHETT